MRRGIFAATLPQDPGRGGESVVPKSEEFRTILSALPVVKTSAEFRWMRKECGGIMGLECGALWLKIVIK